ncbi:MAG: lysylphosphatidylglycerol synthase transmembrane domain-containing protein [Acidiferrobacterales bacterium]
MTINKQRLSVIAGIALGVFFLWFSLKDTDFAQIGQALARSQFVFALPLLAALVLFYYFKAVRIRMLLMPIRPIPVEGILPAMMIGFAANNLFPARLGELVRVYLLGRQHSLSKTSILATMVVERLFDLLAALGLLALVVIVAQVPIALVKPGYFVGGLELTLLLITIAMVMWTGMFVRAGRWVTSFLPRSPQSFLTRHIELGAAGTHALKQPQLLFGIATTSVIQSLLRAAAMYLAVLAVGIDVPISAAFVLLALNIAAITLPSAPGFFGTIQLCYVLALKPFGIDPSDAFAASIFYHVLDYIAVTVTGFYYLKGIDQNLGGIRKDVALSAEALDAPAGR